MILGTKKFE